MRIGRSFARLLIAIAVPPVLALALADPYAPVINPPDAFIQDPTCELIDPLFGGAVPEAQDVPIPAYPNAIFAAATPPLEGSTGSETYDVLPSVRLITGASIDQVSAFYEPLLDESWSVGDVFGTVVFYQHEPVDDLIAFLYELPGSLPVIEIGEIFFDCDKKLDPSATTYVTIYYTAP